MVGLIVFGRPDSFVIDPKVYASKFKPTYRTFGTVTTHAAETTPIGLPADAQAAKVFAAQLRQLYNDGATLCLLPGPAKTLHRDTDGNKPYRLAVSVNV